MMLKIDGFDEAVIGPALLWGAEGRRVEVLVYDAEKIRSSLMRAGMSHEDAREYIEYNIEGAYVGEYTPVLVWPEDFVGASDE
jgi:hypothetical protein